MSNQATTPEQKEAAVQADNLEALKQSHDYYATAIQILTTRVQYFHEEFAGVNSTVAFLRHLRDQTLAAIHKIEPPKAPEAAPVLDIDCGVNPGLQAVPSEDQPVQ